ADHALRDRRFGYEERASDLDRREPGDRTKGERDLGLARQSGVATGEDELEAFVGKARARHAHRWLLQLGNLHLVTLLAPQAVDPFAARGRHEPHARVVGNALARPVLECGDERVLHALLGEIEVPEAPHERRGEPAGLLTEDRGHRIARDVRVQCTTIGRTSTSPPGQLLAIAIAASRSGTSTIRKPPTCSFDSMKGPSVTFIVPF